jgi:pSer/pThr/pTyr-binding forkhead associated (FHA) protein
MMELHICSLSSGVLLRKFALGEECDIRIKSPVVSREHCTIEQNGNGGLVLTDCDSTAGTFVEDKKIDSIRLEDGLEVTVGPALLRFYDSGI